MFPAALLARLRHGLSLHVTRLKRVRIGNVALGQLTVGQWRYLAAHEWF